MSLRVAAMIAEAGMFSSAAMFGVLAGAVAAACTVPYVRDTLRGNTVPHRGSWLIWGVLEVVAWRRSGPTEPPGAWSR